MRRIPISANEIDLGPFGFVDFVAELLNATDDRGFECGVVMSEPTMIALVGVRMFGAPRFVVMSPDKAREAAKFCRQDVPSKAALYAQDVERLTLLATHLEGFADHADAVLARERGTLH